MTQATTSQRMARYAEAVVLASALGGLTSLSACSDCECNRSAQSTRQDLSFSCPDALPQDTLAAQRKSCTFTSGATVAQTLGLPPGSDTLSPIRHIIVLMKENRSFDHLLGKLHDEGQPEVPAVPSTFSNPNPAGDPVFPFLASTTALQQAPGHDWRAMHQSTDGGAMDGFVMAASNAGADSGDYAMSTYGRAELPFYYWLASTFALNDRHFASALSGTFPNRDFLLLGTNDGVQNTGPQYPNPQTPTIFQALDKAGWTWGVYSSGSLLSGALGWTLANPGTYCFHNFMRQLDSGTLPNVAFVDGIDNMEDDHPPADLRNGETWVRQIYEHAVSSPQWRRMAIIWTYDEGGGFADHVPPPTDACVARPIAKDAPYTELGPRVPFVVISPYAKPHYVSHVVQEHTSITRFIEAVFDLPALTARDANSDALLDMMDFSCDPPMLHPPKPPAPVEVNRVAARK